MHDVALDLLILLAGVWLVAVTLRPLGLPTVMGELIVGVLVGPAVFGLIEPDDAIRLLAEIGIFFLMFHAGVETQPHEFCLPARAPPIAPARPHPQHEFDMDYAASAA